MSRLRRSFALTIGGVVLAACSLFTDLSELEEPPAIPDGGTGGPDVPGSSSSSGGDGNGGGADAGADGDTEELDDGGCITAFCDDFTDASSTGEGWNEKIETGGLLRFDYANFQSPPKALRATIDADGGSISRAARIRKDLPTGAKLTCTFRVRLSAGVTTAESAVDLIRFEAGDPNLLDYALTLAVRGAFSGAGFFNANLRDDYTLLDGGCDCPRSEQYFTAPPTQTWTRISFSTDFTKGTAKVTYDGTTVAFEGGPFGKVAPTRISVLLGLRTRAATAPDVTYDDVRCVVQ